MKYNNMMNVSCNLPHHHGDCHHSNISYPYTMNHPHGPCSHVHDTPCQLPKDYRAGGFMTDNAFMLINSTPFLYDARSTKYSNKINVSENVFTRVTQRRDDSCINLNASFNMCDSNNTNTVLNHFLEQIILNKYNELNGVLGIIKPSISFTLFFTIRDSNNMVVYNSNSTVVSHDILYHSTDIVDYFMTSARNLIVGNIPQLEYQGLYSLTLDRIDASVQIIDTSQHIVDKLNPLYQFTKNNTVITIQHDIVEQTDVDDTLLIASCDINYTVNFQASLTTRLRVSFNAFMSNLISVRDTFKIWEALRETDDQIIQDIKNRLTFLEDRMANKNIISVYEQGVNFMAGDMVWLNMGELYQATMNFLSNSDGYTVAESFQTDTDNGNIIPCSSSAGGDGSTTVTQKQYKYALNFKTSFGTDIPNKLNADMYLAELTPPVIPSINVLFINIDETSPTYMNTFGYFIQSDTGTLIFLNSSMIWTDNS